MCSAGPQDAAGWARVWPVLRARQGMVARNAAILLPPLAQRQGAADCRCRWLSFLGAMPFIRLRRSCDCWRDLQVI
ncbi:MAG: hypothetical protein CVV08_21425 [Gammaproteobacteria bacterium HGW-Gammaproteobacteria-12]|nr:MAG: hypothetical protein CVV08_21425 [Gammaproteobacteria bacterium HGW-Gammaproteobacteria-12]